MATSTQTNSKLTEAGRKDIAEDLSRLLADTYVLYIKTHNYHWNVTGPMFPMLHTLFETQYQELATAVDMIAERIRALGFRAPGSYAEFSELTQIKENRQSIPAKEMIADLVQSHQTLIGSLREAICNSENANDQSTADLLTGRLETHEKTNWMLKSTLE